MKEDQFIKENAGYWQAFEETIKKLKSKGFKRFERDELDNFLTAYNRISGHLSYSRTNFGSSNTSLYLNRLVSSAHSYIYATKTSNIKSILSFFIKGFPLLTGANKGYILTAALIFLSGLILSFVYTVISPDNAYAFLPQVLADNINFKGVPAQSVDGSIISSFIFTNNIRVGFVAFALGITLGIGTVWAMLYSSTSMILGALAALAWHQGESMTFWSLILPHGILELFSIFVCGGAGLIIGYSIINPGIYSRKDSFILRGKTAIKLVLGTIPLFVVAGLIEGFITPSLLQPLYKLFIAVITLGLLLAYLIIPNIKCKSRPNNV